MITIYAKAGCEYCIQAKKTLNERNIPFKEKTLGLDFTREDITLTFPTMKTYPIITENGLLVGGFAEMLTELNRGTTFGRQMLNE